MITQYYLITHHNPDELTELVFQHLKLGWKLYGSPCVSSADGMLVYAQAVTHDMLPNRPEASK